MFFLRSGPAATAPVVERDPGDVHLADRRARAAATRTAPSARSPAGNAGGRTAIAPRTSSAPATSPPVSPPTTPRPGPRRRSAATGAGATGSRTIGEWPPVWRVATHSPLDYQGLAAVVRTAVEDGDEAVGIKPLKDGDRAVWRAAMTMGGKQIDVVVDQQTGIVTWYSDGEDTFTAEVDWGSPPPAGTTYTVDVPAGTEVEDDRRHGRLRGVAGGGGAHRRLRPARLGPGAGRLRAQGRRDRRRRLPAAAAGSRQASDSRPGRRRRGTGGPAAVHARPLLVHGGAGRTRATPLLRRAAAGLAGGDAATRSSRYRRRRCSTARSRARRPSPGTRRRGRRCSSSGARRAVFVTGALTRQELIAFAEGLKPVPANAGR